MPILHSCGCNYHVEPYRVHFRVLILLCSPTSPDYLYCSGPRLDHCWLSSCNHGTCFFAMLSLRHKQEIVRFGLLAPCDIGFSTCGCLDKLWTWELSKLEEKDRCLATSQFFCGLLSTPMTLPGIRLGRVQAGIETPAPSVTLTDFSQSMEPPLGILLTPHTAACLPTILPAWLQIYFCLVSSWHDTDMKVNLLFKSGLRAPTCGPHMFV